MQFYEGQLIISDDKLRGSVSGKVLVSKAGKQYYKGEFISPDSEPVDFMIWDINSMSEETLNKFSSKVYIEVKEASIGKYNERFSLNRVKYRILTNDEVVKYGLIPSAPTPFEELKDSWEKYTTFIKRQERKSGKKYGSDLLNTLFPKMVKAAAIRMHHAYQYGMLEHAIQVAKIARAIASTVPVEVDMALVIMGSLIHDVGKLTEYKYDEFNLATDSTNEGKLLYHLQLGLQWLVEHKSHFSETVYLELAHIIASHHDKREFGAIVEPLTVEAKAVALADGANAMVNHKNLLDFKNKHLKEN